MKERSVLNELYYYHVANGLPPDLILFEGFAVDVIISFIREGVFELDELNRLILNFDYSESDKGRKPQIVKTKPLNCLKVKQTACEMWTLIRLLPLMIRTLVPHNHSSWNLYIKFAQLVETLCDLEFNHIDLMLLQDKIDIFFPKFLDNFPDVSMKPKGHFTLYYPAIIRKFGPLIKTLRFESKIGYFKSTFQSNKNRKNICLSMAKRHQILMYLHHSKSTFLEFEVSKGIGTKEIVPEILEPHVREPIDRIILYEVNSFCQSNALVREGNKYGEDEYIIIAYEDEPSFGLINSIFHIQRKDYLLCELPLVNQFNTHFNSY